MAVVCSACVERQQKKTCRCGDSGRKEDMNDMIFQGTRMDWVDSLLTAFWRVVHQQIDGNVTE